MKYCWTTINVADLEASLSFYQDIVGLKINRRFKPNDGMEIVFLGGGDTEVELIYNQQNTEITIGKDISLGFVVESLSQFTEFLHSKNIEIQSGPFQPNPSIRFLYVLDPNGLKIQFVEHIS